MKIADIWLKIINYYYKKKTDTHIMPKGELWLFLSIWSWCWMLMVMVMVNIMSGWEFLFITFLFMHSKQILKHQSADYLLERANQSCNWSNSTRWTAKQRWKYEVKLCLIHNYWQLWFLYVCVFFFSSVDLLVIILKLQPKKLLFLSSF